MHKRALGAVAVTGVAALALGACGGSSPTTPSNTAAGGAGTAGSSETATTTTTAAAAPTTTAAPVRDASVDLVIWTDNDRAPAIKKYADLFGQEQGIKVSVQVAPDVRANFKDATNAGKGPDVIVGAHDWLGELVQNNAVSPINLSSDLQSKFLPAAVGATKFNGQIYGVPYAIENIGLVRNTALAPDAPKTYEEMVAKGQALVKAGKADGIVVQEVSKVGNAYYTYPYLKAFGGGIFAQKSNGDYDPNKVIVDSAGSIKGAQQLAEARSDEGPLHQRRRHQRRCAVRLRKVPLLHHRPVGDRQGQEGEHQVRDLVAAHHRRWPDEPVPRGPDVLRLGQGEEQGLRRGVRHEVRARTRTCRWTSSRSATDRRRSPKPTPRWRPPTQTSRPGTRRARAPCRCRTSQR